MKGFFTGKIAYLVIATGFMLFITVSASASELNSEKLGYKDFLKAYAGTHQEIIALLERARDNAAKIAKLMQEADRLGKLMAKNIRNEQQYITYKDKYDSLLKSIEEKYAIAFVAASLHFEKVNIETTQQKKIERVLNDTVAIYKDTLSCFDQSTYAGAKPCERFRKLCANYGNDDGNMYYYELTNDLEVKKIDVSESDPRLLEPFDSEIREGMIILKDAYNFCRLLSITAKTFTPKQFAKVPDYSSRFIESFYGHVLPYPSVFKERCIDRKPSEQRVTRLLELNDKYPNEWIVKNYYKDYEKWQSACGKAARQLCENTYVIKDQVILSYETVACTIREVTKEDVEQDIRWMDLHSDKLKHSTLLDTINICQLAHTNGFFWPYQKPKLSDKCKKESNKTKKKGKQ